MKINFSNIHFQKTLRAKCAVLKDGISQDANIYELDYRDWSYCSKISKDEKWRGASFLYVLKFAIDDITGGKRSVYVVEDSINDDCIGYCVMEKDHRSDIIRYIETLPKAKSPYKYIGESLITFLLKEAKEKGKSELSVYNFISKAKDFYLKKCHFTQWQSEDSRASIDCNDLDKLEKQNQNHTKKSIEYFG